MITKYIELHLHLDGAVRLQTLYDIAVQKNILPDNVKTIESFSKYVSLDKKESFSSLTDCLNIFGQILNIISGNKEILERIAYELCEDQYNNGILYTEVRYNPHILMGNNLTLTDVVESVNKGIKNGCRAYPIYVNTILCCLRSKPEWSDDIVKLAIKYENDGVVGIDMAGDEYNYSDELHRKAFDLAHKHNLNITIHAGESGGDENISSAINNLHAKRIGHGYASINNPTLRNYLKVHNIHLECCPTSSIKTKSVKYLNEHPIKIFNKEKLNYSINTDDPSIFNVIYQDEIDIVQNKLELKISDIKNIMFNSLESAFISKEQKITIGKQLETNWNK